jgi:putative membrane protein
VNCRRKVFIAALLVWYVIFSISMAITPADRQFWLAANILPVIFVATLVVTHRLFPLSNGSYLLITIFLTLHTIGVHYTYAQAPFGELSLLLPIFGRTPYCRQVGGRVDQPHMGKCRRKVPHEPPRLLMLAASRIADAHR